MVPWHSLDPDSILANAFYRWAYSWAGFIMVAGSSYSKGPFQTRWEGTEQRGPALSLPENTSPSGPQCYQLHNGPRNVLILRFSTQACWKGLIYRQFQACASKTFPGRGTQILQWACHLNWGVPFLSGSGGDNSAPHTFLGSL